MAEDWARVARRWRLAGHSRTVVNAMLADVHARGLESAPPMPSLPPQPGTRRRRTQAEVAAGYRAQVAEALQRARKAIADGTPREEAARTHGVPPRLWRRLDEPTNGSV